MPKPRELVGQRFGNLEVIAKLQSERLGSCIAPMWLCRCDCGKEKKVPGAYLIRGSTKSCGCGIVTSTPRFSAEERLYNNWKVNSSVKLKNPNLTLEQFTQLTKGDCYYCGVKPLQMYSPSNGVILYYNGIDRIDNSIGYEYSNCRSCCGDCNRMKLQMSEKEFFAKIEKIYNLHICLK